MSSFSAISNLYLKLFGKTETRGLIIGNDAAVSWFSFVQILTITTTQGKTTILYKLKLGEIVTTIPTIGKFLFAVSLHHSWLSDCRV